MSRAKPENFMQDAFPLEFVNNVSYQLHIFSLFVGLLLDDELDSAVVPLGDAIFVLERDDHNICIIVTSEEMLVGVDEGI